MNCSPFFYIHLLSGYDTCVTDIYFKMKFTMHILEAWLAETSIKLKN